MAADPIELELTRRVVAQKEGRITELLHQLSVLQQEASEMKNENAILSEANERLKALKIGVGTDGKSLSQSSETDFKKQVLETMLQPPGDAVKLADITGHEDIKEALLWTLGLPAKKPDFFQLAHSQPKGILLIGPPGCGKTMTVRAVAAEFDVTVFNAKSGDLTSKWHGESQKITEALFEVAEEYAPSVIVIDEIDAQIHNRKDGDSAHETKEVNSFLSMIEGYTSKRDRRVVVIGTTNRPWAIDEAGLRRFDVKLYMGLPLYTDRIQFIRDFFSRMDRNVVLTGAELKTIASWTDKYSFAAMESLCRRAAHIPLEDFKRCHGVDRFLAMKYYDAPVVEMTHFHRALPQVDSGIKEENLERLEEFIGQNRCNPFSMNDSSAESVPLDVKTTFAKRLAEMSAKSETDRERWMKDEKRAKQYTELARKSPQSSSELRSLEKYFHRHNDRQLFTVKSRHTASGPLIPVGSVESSSRDQKATFPSFRDYMNADSNLHQTR